MTLKEPMASMHFAVLMDSTEPLVPSATDKGMDAFVKRVSSTPEECWFCPTASVWGVEFPLDLTGYDLSDLDVFLPTVS